MQNWNLISKLYSGTIVYIHDTTLETVFPVFISLVDPKAETRRGLGLHQFLFLTSPASYWWTFLPWMNWLNTLWFLFSFFSTLGNHSLWFFLFHFHHSIFLFWCMYEWHGQVRRCIVAGITWAFFFTFFWTQSISSFNLWLHEHHQLRVWARFEIRMTRPTRQDSLKRSRLTWSRTWLVYTLSSWYHQRVFFGFLGQVRM